MSLHKRNKYFIDKMAEEKDKEKDMLFYGLPAVFYKGKYLVFSPYAKKIVALSEEELNKKETLEELTEKNFFGKPKREEDNNVVRVTLTLTNSCSMHCEYCFGSFGKGNSMSEDLAFKVLDELIEKHPHKKFYIHFFGGEPTLNFPLIEGIVKYLEGKVIDSFYRINTNGVVPKRKLEFMLNYNFHFDISCDGFPEIQDKQRPLKNGKGSSKYVEETIKFLAERNADFKVKSVITRETTKYMPEIVNYLADLGVKLIRLEPVIIHGRAEESGMESVNPNEFVDYFFKALEVAKAKKVYVSNWAYRNILEPKDYFCRTFKSNRIIITPNGLVTKCIEHAISVGKVDKGLILDEDKIRLLQEISVEKMPKCQKCFAKYICSGGCYYQNFHENGSFYEPTKEKCEINKRLLKELIIRMYEA